MTKVATAVTTEIGNSAIEQMQEGIELQLKRIAVTGDTLNSWTGFKTATTYKGGGTEQKVLIGRFDKGYAEALQKGRDSYYFREMDLPRFISYKEDPGLEEWARRKLRRPPETGLWVGGPGTRYGNRRNRWLDAGVRNLRRTLKSKVKERLLKIRKL